MEEIIQINELPVAQHKSLLRLSLYATAFNPGTAAPRRLRLPKGRARTFPDLPLAVITLVPRHLYQRYPHLAINLRDGEIDGRERVTCNLRKNWKVWLRAVGMLASGALPCPCEGQASAYGHLYQPQEHYIQCPLNCTRENVHCTCGLAQFAQKLVCMFFSLPEWEAIARFDNEKNIKLQLRMLLNVSDRYFADADDHLFEENVTMPGHDKTSADARAPNSALNSDNTAHPHTNANARALRVTGPSSALELTNPNLPADEAQPDVNPRVEIDPQARFLPALPVAEPLLLGNFEGANMPEPNALPFGPDDWLPDDQAHDDHGEMEMDELIQLLQENI
ncbi:uncharacterized protein MONBRDRAFT_29381 [Monosiga brevicollis MX1]|uniref:Uncharacterized protein n=1 Tax=Monosiga brevicollis TaxID=81824 RepID=A9VAX5_MONBE|nr:uncharacterized protein MONBRDRAFT_29381 [Monosiga brevicollis MX1]EDQ85292.1 predicted protein [Monosiga brevicollis MX1]|eukprot:XP_001749913.1 hypothetical protein [Monosiga brevicollis MX1]